MTRHEGSFQKRGREEAVVTAALLLAFLILSALAILFLESERGRNTLLTEYQTDRDASALFELLRSAALSPGASPWPGASPSSGAEPGSRRLDLSLPNGILGFGLYDREGSLLTATGEAPEGVETSGLQRASERFAFDARKGTITLIRPLGVFPSGGGRMYGGPLGGPGFMFGPSGMMGGAFGAPNGRGGYGNRGEGFGAPGARGYGYGSSGMAGMMGGSIPPSLRGAAPVSIPAYLYLRKEVRGYFGAQTTLLAAMGALPVAFAAALLLFGRLYRKNRRYRERLAAQANLVHLGEIARTLSHEIKNPLGSIKLQTGILKRLLASDPPRELGLIEEETDQLNRLVERIGEFLRDPVGKPIPVAVGDFLANLTSRFDWKIESGSRGGEDYFVLFDPDRLRSVLENLLKNAVESGGADMPVRIDLEGTRGQVIVKIVDRGPGLPNGDAIFDPFFTTKTKGSGIGLAISKRFVEAAGGALTLRNGREGGAEALVSLRRVYPDGAQAPQRGAE